MAEDKNGFLLYKDLIKTVEKLPKEKAGELFMHILKYVNDENPETDDLIIEIAFEPIKQKLKRDLKKYEQTKEKNRENANKRWQKEKATESNGKKENATASDRMPDDAKHADSDNDTGSDTDIDSDTVFLLEKETKEENFIKEFFPDDKELENEERKKVAQKKEKFKPPSVDEVQAYCNERQNGIQAFKFVNFYQSKGWKVGNQAMKDWKAAVRTWEQKDKENGKSNNNNSGAGYTKTTTPGGNAATGKTPATTAIARHLAKLSSGNSQSGDFTADAEIV
ncbi:DUF6291 domain-containing protein [Chryseobacterium zhengzhouense]|uniref:DUF6291 domain-containing protein n=1 Tax=Chryseobacterium zhengzhouense TaxID=1636086 RepID=A0ABW2M195_9FLAO